jgi:hypothetical protein
MKNFILSLTVISLLACQSESKKPTQPEAPQVKLTTVEVKLDPVEGFNFKWGGFSGLSFIKKEKNGDLLFWTLTDRGPNGPEFKRDKKVMRGFFSPNFNPSFIQIKYVKADNKVVIVKTIPFHNTDNKPMTGLPPTESISKVESATDLVGTSLESSDNNGVDSESMTVDDKNHFWIGEEYFPSILEFDAKGKLLSRLFPASKPGVALNKNELPNAYAHRGLNRGFEALGYKNAKIFFMAQSPLKVSDAYKDKEFSVIRIGVFNTKTRMYEGEYIYPLTHKKVDKIGDLVMINENEFYVIEQNGDTGPNSTHLIYKVDLSKATNLVKSPLERDPETYNSKDLLAKVIPVTKTLAVNLVTAGYSDFEKIEGLTIIDNTTLAVINDNDFGVDNDKITDRKTVLGIIAQ